MIRLVKLPLQAAVAELERRYPEPIATPVTVIAADEKSAPWNMVQEVAPAPKRRRRKVAAS